MNAPQARFYHSMTWTGSEILVWGGQPDPNLWTDTGGVYDPALKQWTDLSTLGAPVPRSRHTAIWSGKFLMVWGGQASPSYFREDTGGLYDPSADTWGPLSSDGVAARSRDRRHSHRARWDVDVAAGRSAAQHPESRLRDRRSRPDRDRRVRLRAGAHTADRRRPDHDPRPGGYLARGPRPGRSPAADVRERDRRHRAVLLGPSGVVGRHARRREPAAGHGAQPARRRCPGDGSGWLLWESAVVSRRRPDESTAVRLRLGGLGATTTRSRCFELARATVWGTDPRRAPTSPATPWAVTGPGTWACTLPGTGSRPSRRARAGASFWSYAADRDGGPGGPRAGCSCGPDAANASTHAAPRAEPACTPACLRPARRP